jgi:hypothetical protein
MKVSGKDLNEFFRDEKIWKGFIWEEEEEEITELVDSFYRKGSSNLDFPDSNLFVVNENWGVLVKEDDLSICYSFEKTLKRFLSRKNNVNLVIEVSKDEETEVRALLKSNKIKVVS